MLPPNVHADTMSSQEMKGALARTGIADWHKQDELERKRCSNVNDDAEVLQLTY